MEAVFEEPIGTDTNLNQRWSFKTCPRCRGDLFLDFDEGRVVANCLQLGFAEFSNQPELTRF